MERGRKSAVALALPLLIHLLLRAGDAIAARDGDSAGKIILEEVIVAGSGNSTRIIANAVEEDPARIGRDILSLLSKREARGANSARTTLPSYSDQDAQQTRVSIVDDEDDIEKLKRVIAKYEPQRIVSRKTKRKIIDARSGVTRDVHDADDKVTERTVTDLERTYHEMLRNVSRSVSQLAMNNADATSNPYLSVAMRNFKRVNVPEATIYSATNGGTDKPISLDVASLYTPRIFKKTGKLPKKYLHPSRAFSRLEESKPDEEIADSNESITSKEFDIQAPSETTARPRNGSSEPSSSAVYPADPTEQPGNIPDWNIQDSRIAASPFTSRANDSDAYNVFHADRPWHGGQSNFPSDLNSLRPSLKYGKVPRPFALSGLSANTNTHNLESTSYSRTPSRFSPSVKSDHQATRSSGNVLPLILPTEFFNPPPVRRYVQIKRAESTGSPATFIGPTSLPANRAANAAIVLKNSPSANYADFASYANVIGATTAPTIVANDLRRDAGVPNYRAENPARRITVRTNPAMTAASVSGHTTAVPYFLWQQKDPRAAHGKSSPVRISYGSPGDGKLDLKANPGLALYDRFANLYAANVPDASRAIAQDYRDLERPALPSRVVASQPISAPAYAAPKSVASLTKTHPTIVKPLAPYYDDKLFALRDPVKQIDDDGNHEERAKTDEQPRADDTEATEKEIADDGSAPGNRKTNRGTYKIHETPKERVEKEDREEERQRTRDYGHRDEPRGSYDEDDNESTERNRHGNKKDTHEDEEDDEDKHDRDYNDRYNDYEYYRNDAEEERREGAVRDRKKYDGRRDRGDDRESGAREAADNNKYLDNSRYEDRKAPVQDEEHRYDRQEAGRDYRYGKNQRDRDREEDEAARSNWAVKQRARNEDNSQRAKSRDRHEEDDEDAAGKREHHRYRAISPKDPRRERKYKEEYGETSPEQVRDEYRHRQQPNVEADPRDHDDVDRDDNKNEEARDHAHGESKEHAHKHEEKHHEKKHHGGGDHKFAEGGGAEHEEEHHGHKGEKGDKGYKVWHEHEKAAKGHHDKEHGSKEYDEKKGEKKKHEEEDGYHKEHHHDEEGQKAAEFGEKGEHQKGHSTKGEHSVHKKDEYEKKTEFFDEFHEDGDVEKHGEDHHAHESKKGGHEKKAHHDAAHHEEKHGKEEKHEKGGHHHEHKGHKADESHDHHHDHGRKHGKKGGHESGKKWSYKKGDGGDHKHDR